eukprot:7151033-Alexandrium_andersonii.AAC.1
MPHRTSLVRCHPAHTSINEGQMQHASTTQMCNALETRPIERSEPQRWVKASDAHTSSRTTLTDCGLRNLATPETRWNVPWTAPATAPKDSLAPPPGMCPTTRFLPPASKTTRDTTPRRPRTPPQPARCTPRQCRT